MAHRIADELLQMILAPSLHVSDDKFSSVSYAAFGSNVNFPASSVLLVCKRWLRIATPLLYEVVVLRSTAQAQALAEAFSRHRAFPLYVKKIRLEGAYICLWDVFKPCSNLHTLCFTLDIYAVVAVSGLCRALRSINPTRVILLDQCETRNAKIEQVFSRLIESIPQWTNLTEFHFPYALTESWFRGSKPKRLAVALSESTTLRTVSAELPLTWDETWSTMATNPNIIFKFKENRAESDLKRYFPIIKTIFNDPKLAVKMDATSLARIILKAQKNLEKPSAQTPLKPSFTPLAHVLSSTAESLWTMIFAFATSPGHPDALNLSELTGNRAALCSINFTRKNLTLVSKQFQRLSQQFLFKIPLLVTERSLTRLVLRCSQDPSVLHQVRVFSLYMLGSKSPSDVDFELTALIPHLIGLEHFVGGISPSISSTVFTLLAETAGPSLITIRHLSIAVNDTVPYTVFARFRRLTRIEFARSPQLIPADISMLPSNLLPFFPELVAATFPRDPFMRSNLRICGPRLVNLEITGGSTKYTGILERCPRLRLLKWTGRWEGLSGLLRDPACHSQLVKIRLRVPSSYMINKDVMSGLKGFFPVLLQALGNNRLPSLREINISGYKWPIEEREIEKDAIVKHAIKIKTTFSGVNITDEEGYPWRIRAERRR